MSAEFVDTNILIYAHDERAGVKHHQASELIVRLFEEGRGALSVQVLCEFFSAATTKLPVSSEEAEAIISDLGVWTIHRPGLADILQAGRLQRKFLISWWDALVLNSATQLGCATLWSEDFTHGRQYGPVTVRNPFR